jgi:hypothetical protein
MLGSLVVFIIAVYVGAMAIGVCLPGLEWVCDRRFTRDLVGVPVVLWWPIESYESGRSFQGDGNSIDKYRLPKTIAELTRRPGALAGYPHRPDYRIHWKVREWRPGAEAQADARYIDFALGGSPKALTDAARAALRHPGAWYALFYNEFPSPDSDPTYIGDVDLFILDPTTGTMFVVNQNT